MPGTEVKDSGAVKASAITKSDTDLIFGCRALWVGTGGDVAVLACDDSPDAQPAGAGVAVLFTNVPSGSILPVAARKVMSTSTTASGIVVLR